MENQLPAQRARALQVACAVLRAWRHVADLRYNLIVIVFDIKLRTFFSMYKWLHRIRVLRSWLMFGWLLRKKFEPMAKWNIQIDFRTQTVTHHVAFETAIYSKGGRGHLFFTIETAIENFRWRSADRQVFLQIEITSSPRPSSPSVITCECVRCACVHVWCH